MKNNKDVEVYFQRDGASDCALGFVLILLAI